MIYEGSYPYVHGGVSSWGHQYIQGMPEHEFVLWLIGANAKDKDKFKYELPKNVVEVHQLFLDDALALRGSAREAQMFTQQEQAEISKLITGQPLNWDILFSCFYEKQMNPASFLVGESFLKTFEASCREHYPHASYAEFFHTVRSMLLPELYLLTQPVPKADIYHATCTGYSGLLGSLGSFVNKKPFIVTEHGIYTREREEEILRAKWVVPYFRHNWIDLFYQFSSCAYSHAAAVTTLYEQARQKQIELGSAPEKTSVIANGIHYERFCGLEDKQPDGYIDIGAVVRIAKIKDIKTMIYAFTELKARVKNARLHIMGDVDDKDYYKECLLLVKQLGTQDIIFTGMVNVIEYMEKLDFTILTSISEAQPLAVIESFAAKRPCVTTDVGSCRELLFGCCAGDDLGQAGYCAPPMNKEELALAMERMCKDAKRRREMGAVGRKRAQTYFTHQHSMQQYKQLYREVVEKWQA
ncbi:MAG: GT4 family glycosyltransferase PelF [Oscillospiraceae bacterium]|nr:GT4 family glycosyltransferase PelF [Oscillospiraceae bacterium]